MQDMQHESAHDIQNSRSATNMIAQATRIGGALVSVGLVLGIIYWAFLLGQRDATELPVIHAQEGLARISPEDPGGTQADHQGLAVNEVLGDNNPSGVDTNSTLAPDTQTVTNEDAAMGELQQANTQATIPDTTNEVAQVEAEPEAQSEAEDTSAAETTEETVTALAEPMDLPVRRPTGIGGSNASNQNDGGSLSDVIDGLVQEVAPEEGDSSVYVAAVEPAESPYGNPQLSPGSALVQLGAYNSLVDAKEAWENIRREHGDLLAGLDRYIEPSVTGTRVMYRLRAAGLDSVDETNNLCAALESRDVECISVTMQ